MTTAPEFHLVPQHVARNPVARAVARTRMTQAVLDFQIRLHLLPAGTEVRGDTLTCAHVLAVAAAVLQHEGTSQSPHGRVIAGAMTALAQCSERGFAWQPRDAVAVDQALVRALEVYGRASAWQTQQAYVAVGRLASAAQAGA